MAQPEGNSQPPFLQAYRVRADMGSAKTGQEQAGGILLCLVCWFAVRMAAAKDRRLEEDESHHRKEQSISSVISE
jgi:hypothetical protein